MINQSELSISKERRTVYRPQTSYLMSKLNLDYVD